MLDNKLSNYPKGDGGHKWWTINYQTICKVMLRNLIAAKFKTILNPIAATLMKKKQLPLLSQVFTFFFKSNYRVSQKTHFQNAVGATVHWLNHK